MTLRQRLPEIDDLRGISIIVMILIHTNAYLLGDKWAYNTREISQFAVVAFLFCSAYLSLLKPYPSAQELIPYLWKRLKRLAVPYYIFFTIYILFSMFALGKHFSQQYIVSSYLLTGGIDFNWLVLLFVELMIITPLIQFLYSKYKAGLYIYTFIAFVSSVLFLKYTPLPYYRAIMWLPWSLVVVYTLYFEKLWSNKKIFFGITLLFGLIFIATQQLILLPLHHSFSMYANKYPPNLYHISYSLFAINIIYYMSKKQFFASPLVQEVIHFFSINSYPIFFIHVIVIDAVWKWIHPTKWVLFFLIVTYISALVQIATNKAGEKK
jgi:fucose 4-O-acetylase-like acetyltransferase